MALTSTDKAAVVAVGIGAVFLGAWYLQSRLVGNLDGIVQAVPGVIADTAANVVIGTGAVLGIPQTNMTECERALAEDRTLDASFACPAGKFLGSLWPW